MTEQCTKCDVELGRELKRFDCDPSAGCGDSWYEIHYKNGLKRYLECEDHLPSAGYSIYCYDCYKQKETA